MKKSFILLSLVIAFILAGCSDSSKNDYKMIEQSNNFKLYAYENDDEIYSDYVCFIFNNAGKKIASSYYETKQPDLHTFDNGVLRVFINAGTSAGLSTYYNLETSAVSETYQCVYYDDGEIVIYIHYDESDTYICAKEIFGSDFLLKEKLDTGNTFITGFEVDFSDGVVTVEHPKGEQYDDTIVETFELNRK